MAGILGSSGISEDISFDKAIIENHNCNFLVLPKSQVIPMPQGPPEIMLRFIPGVVAGVIISNSQIQFH